MNTISSFMQILIYRYEGMFCFLFSCCNMFIHTKRVCVCVCVCVSIEGPYLGVEERPVPITFNNSKGTRVHWCLSCIQTRSGNAIRIIRANQMSRQISHSVCVTALLLTTEWHDLCLQLGAQTELAVHLEICMLVRLKLLCLPPPKKKHIFPKQYW